MDVIALHWDPDLGGADLAVAGLDLASDDGLQTAVIISLFTDRRVDADEVPAGETDRAGWWGDGLSPDEDPIGSRLWLLRRRKETPDLPVQAAQWGDEALAWLAAAGVATSVRTTAEWVAPGHMAIRPVIELPTGELRPYEFSIDVQGGSNAV